MKTIFIVGASSQDGKILINKLEGRHKLFCFYRNYYLIDKSLKKNKFSLSNHKLISYLINKFKPYQIYYLSSHNKPFIYQENRAIDFIKNIHINLISLYFFLNAIKNFSSKTKLFYASSSFIFNGYKKLKVNEQTKPKPISFYGFSKTFGLKMCDYYRENYNLFIVTGILFNHDSKFKKGYFFSKQIVKRIRKTKKNKIKINNAYRDWGHAYDYVDAMLLTMRQKNSGNYVISSGKLSSTYEFAKIVVKKLRKNIKLVMNKKHSDNIKICGDNKKLLKIGWKPKYTSLTSIVEEIIS